MTNQFNIQVGDEIAVSSSWSNQPVKRKVVLVTPTGKIRVEAYEQFLLTPKPCYHGTLSWTAQAPGHRGAHFAPWSAIHDSHVARAQSEREYRAKLSAIKQRIDALRAHEVHSIDALCRLLDIQ